MGCGWRTESGAPDRLLEDGPRPTIAVESATVNAYLFERS